VQKHRGGEKKVEAPRDERRSGGAKDRRMRLETAVGGEGWEKEKGLEAPRMGDVEKKKRNEFSLKFIRLRGRGAPHHGLRKKKRKIKGDPFLKQGPAKEGKSDPISGNHSSWIEKGASLHVFCYTKGEKKRKREYTIFSSRPRTWGSKELDLAAKVVHANVLKHPLSLICGLRRRKSRNTFFRAT